MRKFFGILLIILGIAVGIYVDVWIFFVGGITEIVNALNMHPIDGAQVAWGCVKTFLLTGVGIFVTFWILMVPGFALIGSTALSRKRPSR